MIFLQCDEGVQLWKHLADKGEEEKYEAEVNCWEEEQGEIFKSAQILLQWVSWYPEESRESFQ